MIKTRMRMIVLVVCITMICMTFISVGETQLGFKKVMDVWVGSLKINYNNLDLTTQLQPIVIEGTTYLPLSKTGYVFNKEVKWNDITKTVTLTDKPDPDITKLQAQVAEKDAKIKELERTLQSLKDVLDGKNISYSNDNNNDTEDDLEELEDELNDDYDKYYNVRLEFTLTGDEDEIEVEIEADDDDWKDNISSSRERKLFEDVCEDILDEFDDAEITGTVKDGRKTLGEFYTTSSGKVKTGSYDIDELEDDLNEKLEDDDFGKLEDIDNDDLEIKLDGDTDELTYYINIDLDDYESEWTALDDDDIEDFIGDVFEYIEDMDDYEDAKIIGYFYDTDDDERLAKCYKSSNKLTYRHYN